jgi:uroporphyrinogen-III synthase
MPVPRWRVAVTRDDKGEGSVVAALESAGFDAVAVPVLIEGPAPNQQQLVDVARGLEGFDWIICASTRAVRAISLARGTAWPAVPRTAAVGAVTAAAMRDAGASEPVVAGTFTAKALFDTLRSLDAWRDRRVLITTVRGGRRDLIDGLRAEGARVTEIEPYTMTPRAAADIRADWVSAAPDAAIFGSAETAAQVIAAIGIDAVRRLKAIVPIGPTTADRLAREGIHAEPPPQATFAAAVETLKSLVSR